MATYRLKSSITGVECCARGMLVTHIAAGEVLTTPDIDDATRLVEIVYQGRNLVIPVEDLQVSAEVLGSP